jgi:hypothetical protein
VAFLMAVGCGSEHTANKKPTKIGIPSTFAECIALKSPFGHKLQDLRATIGIVACANCLVGREV